MAAINAGSYSDFAKTFLGLDQAQGLWPLGMIASRFKFLPSME